MGQKWARADELDPDGTSIWMYRHYDRDGVLLYVGLATDVHHRSAQHRSKAKWWRFVAHSTARLWDDIEVARTMEMVTIMNRAPLFNVVYAAADRDERVAEYLAHREAWGLLDEHLEDMRDHEPWLFSDDEAA